MAVAQAEEAESSMTQLGQEVLEERWQSKQSQALKLSETAKHAAELTALQNQIDASRRIQDSLGEASAATWSVLQAE